MYRTVIGIVGVLCAISASCKAWRPAAGSSKGAAAQATTGVPDTASERKGYVPTGKDVISVLLAAKGSVAATEWQVRSVGLAPGYVKKGSSVRYAGYLTGYFTDGEGNRLDSVFFESPLARRVEYPTSDDGQMGTTIRQRSEGVGFVRANYQEAMTELHIYDAEGKRTARLTLKKP